ncbi:hypothetical protein LXL04_028952 [Taraxacum kok-saghyz]
MKSNAGILELQREREKQKEAEVEALKRSMQSGMKLLSSFFYYSVQIVLSGKAVHKVAASGATQPDAQQAQRHELRSYLEPLPEQERFECQIHPGITNLLSRFLFSPLYQRAVSKALLDRISDENAASPATTTVVLMVVGAGQRPLVRASLQVHKFHTGCDYIKVGLLRKLNKQEERMCKVRDLSSSMFFLQRLF